MALRDIFKNKKQNKQIEQQAKLIDDFKTKSAGNWNFVGRNISGCWKIRIDLNMMYHIWRRNTLAWSYMELVSSAVGRRWFDIVDWDGEVVDDPWLIEEIETKLFSRNGKEWDFKIFKEQYYTHHFCSWQIIAVVRDAALGDLIQIADPRGVKINKDKAWNITSYEITTKGNGMTKTTVKVRAEDVVDQIVRFNDLNICKWLSVFEKVVYDALIDQESAKRTVYFFVNSAIPDAVFLLDDETMKSWVSADEIEAVKEKIHMQLSWSSNAHKILISPNIKDIKTLNVSNKDTDLIKIREHANKLMWVVFRINPKAVWLPTQIWANSEMIQINRNTQKQIDLYAEDLESFMNMSIRHLIWDRMWDKRIRLLNEQFISNEDMRKEDREDVLAWNMSRRQYRVARWWEVEDLPEFMDEFSVPTSQVFPQSGINLNQNNANEEIQD